MTAPASPPLLETRAITKEFPGVKAVDGVDFTVGAGEVVALLGQNGAGKSTLIKVLAGIYPHGTHGGEIFVSGQPFCPENVRQAENSGVALVPQELETIPELTIAENMFLNDEPGDVFVDGAKRLADAIQVLHEFDIDVDPRQPMGSLDLVTQQMVIIARALSKNAKVLVLDEPSAALTDNEVQRLFEQIRKLCASGRSCIYVSHRLAEVFAIAQRIVVMRDGKICGEHVVENTTRETVVREMVGQIVKPPTPSKKAVGDEVALKVEDLVVKAEGGRVRVDGLNFSVRKGEIVGLFGLLGAGCPETALSVFGAWEGEVAGRFTVHGQSAKIENPTDGIRNKLGLMAQDRRDTIIVDHTVVDNVILACLDSLAGKFGFIAPASKRRLARDYKHRLNIKVPNVDYNVGTLSGGNQQKVHVARWLASGSDILLLIDPTRGVDVGARAEISSLWLELAAQGYSILLVSAEAEELVEICDRVVVMYSGKAVDEFSGPEITEENLFRAAAGV